MTERPSDLSWGNFSDSGPWVLDRDTIAWSQVAIALRTAAQKEVPTVDHMKQACIMGSMMASHTIQDFSIRSLAKVTHDALESRLTQYKKVITV